MKKSIIILLLLLIPLVSAQIEETVENRLTVEFHAVTGTDVIVLDLPRYFGRDADFVYSESEHVDITLDPVTHVATLKAKDPEWRGIEQVVFATSIEYLYEEELPEYEILPPRNVTKVLINVSKEDIALEGDAFTQQEFETIVGNLSSEPIDIVSQLAEDSFFMDINKEATFNISVEESKPKFGLLWKIKENPNMTSARYKEGSDIVTFSVGLFILLAFAVLILYFYYTYAESFKSILLAPKRKGKDVKVVIQANKKEAISKLRSISRRVGKEKSSKLYRECIAVMNQFLSKGLGVRGSNLTKINDKLLKKGLRTGVISKINIFITEHKGRVYSGKKITPDDVNKFILFLKSILDKL